MVPNVKRRSVDFDTNQQDNTALLMASYGKTQATIAAETGLSLGQVQYRCKVSGVSTLNWRRSPAVRQLREIDVTLKHCWNMLRDIRASGKAAAKQLSKRRKGAQR